MMTSIFNGIMKEASEQKSPTEGELNLANCANVRLGGSSDADCQVCFLNEMIDGQKVTTFMMMRGRCLVEPSPFGKKRRFFAVLDGDGKEVFLGSPKGQINKSGLV